MKNKKIIFLTVITIFLDPQHSVCGDTRVKGYLSSRINQYLVRETTPRGFNFFALAESDKQLNDTFFLKLQARWSYQSLYDDLRISNSDIKNTKDFYWGESFIQKKDAQYVLTLGYQELSWGESFGFNYADIVNPKDNKMTFYSNSSETKIPILLTNFKNFFSNGSLQLLYSPEPKFNRQLPISLFTSSLFPALNIDSKAARSPGFFKENEYGGKFSYEIKGYDFSFFYFDYLDRNAHYTLANINNSTLTLQENHARIKSLGLSLSTTINEAYVLRSDLVIHKDKIFNQASGLMLNSTKRSNSEAVISLDTPTFDQFSFAIIGASSILNEKLDDGFRSKNQYYSIIKISYDFLEDKIFDLSYTHQYNENGHSLQSQFTHPLSGNFEYKIGFETYWGEKASSMYQVKKLNNAFVSIKNYF